MLLVRLAGQERKVLLVAVRLAHAAVAMEVRDYRTLLARFSLSSWVKDALDELLLLGELVLCGKHVPLPLLQALRVHGLARIPLGQLPPVSKRRGRVAVAQALDLVVEDGELRVAPGDELVDDVLATSLPSLLLESIRAPRSLLLCCCSLFWKVFEGKVIGLHLLLVIRKLSSQQLWPPLIQAGVVDAGVRSRVHVVGG